MTVTTKTTIKMENYNDEIEQAIDLLIQSKKATDLVELQQIACKLETIATHLRHITEENA